MADYTDHLVRALADAGLAVRAVRRRRAGRRGPPAARAAGPTWCTCSSRPSAFGFSPWIGLLPDLVAAPVVGTLHEYGWWSAPRLGAGPGVAGRWNAGAGSTARPGGWPRPAAAVVTTNAGHARALADRLGIEAARIPLAPNVPDLGAGAGPVGRCATGSACRSTPR